MTCLLLSLALQIAPPEKPAGELNAQDPKSLLEHVAYATRTSKSYEAGWKARLIVPRSDPLDYTGRAVWVKPGVLYSHYTASGGDDKKIVLAGAQAWVYNVFSGWVSADEAGIPGAGRGIQNPDEALAVISKNQGTAKITGAGEVEIVFGGNDIANIMKDQAQQGAFDWKKSTATLRLASDAQRRLKSLSCKAVLVSTDPKVQGEVSYEATIDILSYDQKTELQFLDEKQKPIPLAKKIQAEIQNMLKEKP